MKRFICVILAVLLLAACAPKAGESAEHEASTTANKKLLIVSDIAVAVDEKVAIDVITEVTEPISYSFEGEAIAIYNGCVRGVVAGSEVEVTAVSGDYEGSFTVWVDEDSYTPYGAEADGEGWYEDIEVEPIAGLSEDFAMGVDVSTLAVVLENVGRFYNSDGVRTGVFKLLRDNGVNWVRLRLWNEPYQYDTDGNKLYYGGGDCDFDTICELAADAKAAGMKLLLNFHYSDFWADPTYQVIPKMWKDITSADDMAVALYDYSYEVIRALDAVGAKPDMVQIGNEITGGMLREQGGEDDGSFGNSGYSNYISERMAADPNVAASYSGRGTDIDANLVLYVSMGAEAVKAYDPEILVMIQLAKGCSDVEFMKTFYHTFDTVDYDVIGLSYYPRWHGSIAQLENALSELSAEFPEKGVSVVEFSYAYTYAFNANAENQFNSTYAQDDYPVSVQGQANILRDVIAAIAANENGFGVFYWEGAWLPVPNAGWASSKTKNSWANQALFGYDGKALPSLSVFSRVYG